MAYETHSIETGFVIRWIQTPTRAAVEAVRRDFEAARRAAGVPLALWIVIPADQVDLPPPDARAAFQSSSRAIFDQCASVDMLILGSGVKVSLMRAALRAMAVVTRTAKVITVHASADEAIAARRPPPPIASVLRGRI